MQGKRILLSFIVIVILCFVEGSACAFSTHPSATAISRSFESNHSEDTESLNVTVQFENTGTIDLRGFYYVEHVPQGLRIDTISITIDGHPVSNYREESGLAWEVYEERIPYHWILEMPGAFQENNPLSPSSIVEIIYSITPEESGTFNFDEFQWIGYYQGAPEGQRAVFGHSEEDDRRIVTFGSVDGSDDPGPNDSSWNLENSDNPENGGGGGCFISTICSDK